MDRYSNYVLVMSPNFQICLGETPIFKGPFEILIIHDFWQKISNNILYFTLELVQIYLQYK